MPALGWLLNLGFAGSGAGEEAQTPAGAPAARRRRLILPDGTRIWATDDEIAFLRAEYEARVRSEGQARTVETRRIKAKGRRRAKARTFETPVEILVPDGRPIPLPKSLIPGPKIQGVDPSEAIRRKMAEMRQDDEDAFLLLLMVS